MNSTYVLDHGASHIAGHGASHIASHIAGHTKPCQKSLRTTCLTKAIKGDRSATLANWSDGNSILGRKVSRVSQVWATLANWSDGNSIWSRYAYLRLDSSVRVLR